MTKPATETFDAKLFERRCESYLQFRKDEREAKLAAEELKPWILSQVEKHGLVPTNAEKSRRIDTPGFVATVTTGTTVEINDAKCTELELLLSRAKCSDAFPQLFTRRTEFALAKTADTAMASARWPKRFAEQIRATYGLCFTPKTKTPSLDIDTRAQIEERERKAAEKAAKKPRVRK